MVARSQNGWPVVDRSKIATYEPVPGIRVPLLKGDVATVLCYVAERFDDEVRKLYVPGCWGYAVRKIRGSSTMITNHASGTAEDLIAPDLPLGRDPQRVMTQKEIDATHKILRDCRIDGRPVVRWGGDYEGRKDPMHFEIVGSEEDVARLAKWIKNPEYLINPDGGPRGKFPLPEGHVYAVNDGHSKTHSGYYAKDRPAIRRIQKEIGAKVDGEYGPKTADLVAEWRKKNGLNPHKEVGPVGWAQMVKK